jgi:hypothetical protein
MVETVYKSRKPKASPPFTSPFLTISQSWRWSIKSGIRVLRDVVREVVYKFLGCGDLRKGFARIKCKDCKHEVLLAFSCKGLYFCPFIRKVYETNPLICPKCQGAMCIISFIDQPDVIKKNPSTLRSVGRIPSPS